MKKDDNKFKKKIGKNNKFNKKIGVIKDISPSFKSHTNISPR